MAKFKLIAGRHIEGGKVYDAKGAAGTAGNIVESELALDEVFSNKFTRVGGKTLRPRDRDDTLDSSGRVMDKDLHEVGDEHSRSAASKDFLKSSGKSTAAAGKAARGETDDDENVQEMIDAPDEDDQEDSEEETPKVKKAKVKAKELKKKVKGKKKSKFD